MSPNCKFMRHTVTSGASTIRQENPRWLLYVQSPDESTLHIGILFEPFFLRGQVQYHGHPVMNAGYLIGCFSGQYNIAGSCFLSFQTIDTSHIERGACRVTHNITYLLSGCRVFLPLIVIGCRDQIPSFPPLVSGRLVFQESFQLWR